MLLPLLPAPVLASGLHLACAWLAPLTRAAEAVRRPLQRALTPPPPAPLFFPCFLPPSQAGTDYKLRVKCALPLLEQLDDNPVA